MEGARSKRSIFQKPKKPAKITLTNPSTGQAIQLPSSKDVGSRDEPSIRPQASSAASADTGLRFKPSQSSPDGIAQTSKESKSNSKTIQPLHDDGKAKDHEKPKKSSVSLATSGVTKKPSSKKAKELMSVNNSQDASKLSEASGSQDVDSQWKPDIYAHAYVPEAFLAVNASPAILLSSTPVPAIDFATYTATFAGTLLLPPLLSLQIPMFDGASPVNTLDNLKIDNYDQHQSDCLVLDLEAQVPEIRTYDMFGVQLDVVDRVQEIYSLHVPGLLENTPRVAFGDNIMVRQLVMDPSTKLPLAAPASGSTGFQISAVVVAIDRPKEMIHLRINGFTPHLLKCNISFIVQTRWIKSLQRAVGNMAAELKISQKHASTTISATQTPEDSVSSADHDFGPIGTPIRSPPIRTKQDYFGTVKSPLKSPTVSRQDYFGAIGTPVRSPRVEEPRSHFRRQSHKAPVDAPIQYTNQGWLRRMLFPDDTDGVMQRTLPQGVFKRSWFDRYLNHEQKCMALLTCDQKAVDGVLSRSYGNIPFLVNGPPGTGKTKTIVEIVTQMAFDPDNEGAILVCAPSDSAADTLALRLRNHFEPKVMFRLNDFSRTFAEVPQELLPYCYVQSDIFNLPPLPELMACKVVIATCCATDILVQARVTNGDLVALENTTSDILNPQLAAKQRKARVAPLHWTALLVDEAAQATEPEMLIPISVVAPPTSCDTKPNPILVMAGDQYQLGPRIYNKSTTLRISMFERLSNETLFASHPQARQSYRRLGPPEQMLRPAFVNLTRNYRSHPAILAIPSALFYADTLIPEALDTDDLEPWAGWCGRGWPVLFACNGGDDDCENIQSVGGGWYNIQEAQKAISYAVDLLSSDYIEEQKEICIMSPFRAQVNLLRKIARKAGLWGLNIGPMDAFQGLESRFVILCTTRTRDRFLEEDAIKGMGIVNEPKKFNVAITRAKKGLIVIGNPWVLEQDSYWNSFMRFCWRNGLWQMESDELDRRMDGSQEKHVDDWTPKPGAEQGLSGLERALVYKEREPIEGGSKAVRRFMSERGEDEIWTLGRLAEAALGGPDGHRPASTPSGFPSMTPHKKREERESRARARRSSGARRLEEAQLGLAPGTLQATRSEPPSTFEAPPKRGSATETSTTDVPKPVSEKPEARVFPTGPREIAPEILQRARLEAFRTAESGLSEGSDSEASETDVLERVRRGSGARRLEEARIGISPGTLQGPATEAPSGTEFPPEADTLERVRRGSGARRLEEARLGTSSNARKSANTEACLTGESSRRREFVSDVLEIRKGTTQRLEAAHIEPQRPLALADLMNGSVPDSNRACSRALSASPLVVVENGDELPNRLSLREAVCPLYRILRHRGKPWFKIKVIPAQIRASSENKLIIAELLQDYRDEERARIFRWLFPAVPYKEYFMRIPDQIRMLEEAEISLTVFQDQKRWVIRGAHEFEEEEDRFFTKSNESDGVEANGYRLYGYSLFRAIVQLL
ncbi:MAG: hypothetical protein Q9166_006013 [cf. Caloplaca sp. 2 TL-2023]